MERVRLGVVGCGSLTQRAILPHLSEEDAREVAEVVAVCDVDGPRARDVADRFGISDSYDDYDLMLKHDGLDAVLLITPNPFHFSQAIAGIRAGKHVYVQKTLTISVAEADQVIDQARAAGVKVVASPGQMLLPPWQRIREILREDRIGRVHWAFTNNSWIGHEHETFRSTSDVDPSWYYKAGGGPVYDMGVYSLHALTGLLGPAQRVTAMSGVAIPQRQWRDKTIDVEMDDNTVLMLDFGDSTFGVVSSHFCSDGSSVVSGLMGLFGTSGAIEVTEFEPESIYPPRFTLKTFGGASEVVELPPSSYTGGAHALEPHVWVDIRHFIDCILHDKRPVASAEHARHVIEIIEKGYASARSGCAEPLATTF